MNNVSRLSGVIAVLGLVSACSSSGDSQGPASSVNALGAKPAAPVTTTRHACDTAKLGFMRCFAQVRTDIKTQNVDDAAPPQGLGAVDLRNAYNLPTSGGKGRTVAIVDANHYPNAEADLAVYRSQYGLAPCTTANGCFKQLNETGQPSNYPTADSGWSVEMALDLDMVSAGCPGCNIVLVEASQATMQDLGTAVNTAAGLAGVVAISNSWGGSEDGTSAQNDESYFKHPGISIMASTGDSGFGIGYPASSAYITAVGGTNLAKSTTGSRGWTESAWGSADNANGGAGSGCSADVAKPAFQSGIPNAICAKRANADVSAVADPNSGVAVYDTYNPDGNGASGWIVVGGTSASSPLVAAIYAITGVAGKDNSFSYSNTGKFYDVTTGVNGTCAGTEALCNAGVGWDGPTGNGTPNGAALLAH
jgi:subtilase family serine protease